MPNFAVIDTETTWSDEVMSIGAVISDSNTYTPIDKRYYILTPYKNHGGMYSSVLYTENIKPNLEDSREEVIKDFVKFLSQYEAKTIFAYNANFDYGHLKELQNFSWFDIMKIAAYKQYNPKIPKSAECFSTGRLKRGYGVESIYRMLSGNEGYCELHNALRDAVDELEIMRMLGIKIGSYASAKIG